MDISKNRIALRVWGDYACFTRPEMKAERVSYDVITPSAARGILEAIYWKPEIRWVIERLHVRKPIAFTNIRRNELAGRGPSARTLAGYMEGRTGKALEQVIEDDRQQRATLALRDVEYVIEAHYEVLDASQPPQKHYEMFKRRAEKGQCFHQPCLGCREFACRFAWQEAEIAAAPESPQGETDLGWMLHDIDFANGNTPRFFRAKMVNGVITVPVLDSGEVRT